MSPAAERFLSAVAGRKVAYTVFVLTVAVLAAGVSLLLPVWFRAESTLLPPAASTDTFGTLTGLIQSSALGSLGLVTTSSTSDVFVEILKSRTLHEAAIRQFHLDQVYKRKGMDRTLAEFRHHVSVEAGRSGVVQLSFEDRDPRRAADVANYLLLELDRFNREVYGTSAKRTRQFLESRLAESQKRLAEAQGDLSTYERQNKVIAVPDRSNVEGAASLMAEKMNLQIRRSYVSEYSDPNSPALHQIDAQLAALEREIGQLPSLKVEGARLSLAVEMQSRLYTLLSSQYEEARIQEARDAPTVTVLDTARPPEIRQRPKRGLIVAVSVIVALGLCLLFTALEIRAAEGT